jgi:SAM-dependent methyltransferase
MVTQLGTGQTAWPAVLAHCGYVVAAIDNMRGYWPADAVNRYWSVRDVDITHLNGFKGSFDAITCISVIEHIENHAQAIRNMAGLLKPGGVLIVTTPYAHNTPHPNVYTHDDALYGKNATYICRSSSQAEIAQWLACGLSLDRRELWRLFTGPVWATGQRCDWEKAEDETRPHQLGCFLFRKEALSAPTGR